MPSHSGCNALRLLIAPLAGRSAFFARVLITSAHVNSLHAVSRGQADVCAIDAVTWALVQRHRPRLTAALRVIAWTPRAPALPYVTRKTCPAAERQRLLDALAAAVQDPALAATRAVLLLECLQPTQMADYQPLLAMARRAASYGYAQLR